VLYSRFLGLYVPPIPEKKKLVRINFIVMFNRAIKAISLLKKECIS
jgi:hypothetical protein